MYTEDYFCDGSSLECDLDGYNERSSCQQYNNTNTDYPSYRYHLVYTSWHKNDSQHRTNGPAVIWGRNHGWYLNDVEYTFQEFIEITPISDHEKVELALIYG
jgi:rhamnogalacturonyl hydrolase YesR